MLLTLFLPNKNKKASILRCSFSAVRKTNYHINFIRYLLLHDFLFSSYVFCLNEEGNLAFAKNYILIALPITKFIHRAS